MGGGFHRYSTDRRWLVPHFEKMLYDQAQLAGVYAEAFRRTHNPEYRAAAEDTLDFVLRDLKDSAGGFHSALDAETEGVEGRFYVWDKPEIEKLLGPADAKLFDAVYGLDEPKPFEEGYVLHRPAAWDKLAEAQNLTVSELQKKLAPLRQKLLAARQKRSPLLKDDKILASWNGLIIRALAEAGDDLGRPEYIKAAEAAAVFVLAHMRDKQGRLQRTYGKGQAKLNAYLDDYAFLIEGLLAIYDATQEQKWLNAAQRLMDDQIRLFWDEKGDGFFFTAHHHEELIARIKQADDTVLPSGNSVSVRNLVRLASLTGQDKYKSYAEKTLKLFAPRSSPARGAWRTWLLRSESFWTIPTSPAPAKKHPTRKN